MFVRILRQEELLTALHLTWEVFSQDVAHGYSPEGIEEFRNYIKLENISQLAGRGELVLFGLFEGPEMLGISALKNDGHISLLFVRGMYQRRGGGRMLFQAMDSYARQYFKAVKLSVNAAPGAAEAYRHLGMRDTGPEQTVNGIRFIPMEKVEVQSGPGPVSKKSNMAVIVGLAAAAAVVLLMIGWLGMRFVHNWFDRDRYEHSYAVPYDDYDGYDGYDEDDGYGDAYDEWSDPYDEYDDGGDADDLSGLDALEAYEEPGLSYEYEDQEYNYNSEDTKRTTISFTVYYPEFTGLDEKSQKKVNEALKDCAMETVDKIYLNPSDDVKESVMGEEYPMLASFVRYKVTYMSEDFISVVFEDYNYIGSSENYNVSLRTKNISLKDGSVYAVKDIVKVEDTFVKDWTLKMQDEADSDRFLSELKAEDVKKVLDGDSLNGVYYSHFFVDADGVQIGLSFSYPEGDENDLGYAWVTAEYEPGELRDYQTDSRFWEEIS